MQKWLTGLCLAGLLLLGVQALAAVPETQTLSPQPDKAMPMPSSPKKPKGTMVFVPLDTRPVSKAYTADTMKAAGWEILLPPEELLSASARAGHPDQLFDWLEEQAKGAVAVVVSADSLLYGGLVDSRTHHFDEAVLKSRAERILGLKKKSGNPNVYVFVTIMRSPKASEAPVEPVYYRDWGPQLFRQGVLRDKAELEKLSRKESKELQDLNRTIPRNLADDFYGRRKMNLRTTELLLHGVESGSFNYLLIGRDDTAPLSQAHKEARHLSTLVSELPKEKIRFFSGADQLGLVLLTQAANRLTYTIPLVYTEYAPGKGGNTIPTYEDDTIAVSAREHIYAAGAFPAVKAARADFILAVNTPFDGRMAEASDAENNGIAGRHTQQFLDKVESYLNRGQKVILSDSAYGNGADNALVRELFRRGIAYKLSAYGGWNTSGNSLGFALAQGLESPFYEVDAAKELLTVRYLDDWAYQANTRMHVYRTVIWPNQMPNSGFTEAQRKMAEAAIQEEIRNVAEPVMGDVVEQYDFRLPWNRMFEVQPMKKEAVTKASEKPEKETVAAAPEKENKPHGQSL